MTPEERAKDEAWTRRMVAREDALEVFDCTAGRIPFLAKKFPIPNTDGMTPEEQDATLSRWRAEIRAYIAEADARSFPPPSTRPTTPPVQPTTPPEVPVS